MEGWLKKSTVSMDPTCVVVDSHINTDSVSCEEYLSNPTLTYRLKTCCPQPVSMGATSDRDSTDSQAISSTTCEQEKGKKKDAKEEDTHQMDSTEVNLGASTSKQGGDLNSEGSKKCHRVKKVKKGSYVSRARRMKLRRKLERERQVALSSSSGEEDLIEFEEMDPEMIEELREVLLTLEEANNAPSEPPEAEHLPSA